MFIIMQLTCFLFVRRTLFIIDRLEQHVHFSIYSVFRKTLVNLRIIDALYSTNTWLCVACILTYVRKYVGICVCVCIEIENNVQRIRYNYLEALPKNSFFFRFFLNRFSTYQSLKYFPIEF